MRWGFLWLLVFCFKLNVHSRGEIGRLLVWKQAGAEAITQEHQVLHGQGRSGACSAGPCSGSLLFVWIPSGGIELCSHWAWIWNELLVTLYESLEGRFCWSQTEFLSCIRWFVGFFWVFCSQNKALRSNPLSELLWGWNGDLGWIRSDSVCPAWDECVWALCPSTTELSF